MQKRYVYLLACPDMPWWPIDTHPGNLINELQENSVFVKYSTMRRHCEGLVDWLLWKGVVTSTHGMVQAFEQASWIAFKKGVYDGMPCYFVDWSGIEFIWVLDSALEDRDIEAPTPPWDVEALQSMGLELVDPHTQHLPDFPGSSRVFRRR